MEQHSDIIMGLLYGIFTDPAIAPSVRLRPCVLFPYYNTLISYSQYFRYMQFVTRDSFSFCIAQLKPLIIEKYNKLLDTPRTQVPTKLNEILIHLSQYLQYS